MAVPLRKTPADWESPEAAELDPFRYGWRPKYVRLPNGEFDVQEIPLTLEDLLDPQLGDVVTQSEPHFDLMIVLADLLRRHYASRDDVYVAGDMKMLWVIPGIPEPSPDIAVIFGVRRKRDPRQRSFRCKREGTRPSLIIELVSSIDSGTRNNDYEKKVEIYQRVGIPEYFIFDPPSEVTEERLWLTGYRLDAAGRYREVEPDPQGRLFSLTTHLLFGVEEDGSSPLVIDAATGRTIPTSSQLEEKVQAAEAEIARLRAELDRKDRG
ncbi:MAG TPA: Uma2 family endonuclease [Thermoanaerobaculia bacterium]|jgi:Uma2 family endonuclease|nr:Uma2 family endonuclease [Thermoanaerobaculia bacterium]